MSNKDSYNKINRGHEIEYNATDLMERYHQGSQRVVVTERKEITALKELWNVLSVCVLLALASIAICALTDPLIRRSLIEMSQQFIEQLFA